jgi:molecular chaperone DnaK
VCSSDLIKDFDRTPGGVVLHMDEIIDRPLLEHLAQDLLKRMRAACEVAMAEAKRKDPNFSARDLNDVVLVGGGTRMPAVQALARDIFGQDAKTDIDPEVAVVLGAAIRAAVIEGRKSDLLIQDIIGFSVAVEVYDKVEGVASVVIPRGTPYPSEKPFIFALTNREPGQAVLPLRIVTGDHDRAAACDLLHAIDIPIEPGDPRSERVPFTIALNSKGEPYGTCGDQEWGSAA